MLLIVIIIGTFVIFRQNFSLWIVCSRKLKSLVNKIGSTSVQVGKKAQASYSKRGVSWFILDNENMHFYFSICTLEC